jgi:acetoacetate decarboxylase
LCDNFEEEGDTPVGWDPHQAWSIPGDAPFYPRLPAVYRNVKLHMVAFEAPAGAAGRFLPDPLEPHPDGECIAAGMDIGFSSNYGPFQEAFVVIHARFRGRDGYYCSHVFHNGPAGIAAGREIYGTPKVFAEVTARQQERFFSTRVTAATLPVLDISTACPATVAADALPSLAPCWRLKMIPKADGPGAALLQLVDAAPAAHDQTIHYAAKGEGVVIFHPSPLVDLTPLRPSRFLGAWYVESSYAEGFGRIDHDYLHPEPGGTLP